MASRPSNVLGSFGYDLLLGSITAFYVFTVPYTKVEESFNVQAMHDILYHWHHLDRYDHLEFPGVVPRTFLGAFLVSTLATPVVLIMSLLHLPKIYSLYAVRLVLGSIILLTLRFCRVQVRHKFGPQVEAFFVILSAVQFHLLFYCTRPLPNVLALGLVNVAYAYWIRGSFYAMLNCLPVASALCVGIACQSGVFATLVFRCDILLLLCPIGLELLLTRSISLVKACKWCIPMALLCVGVTTFVDSFMWKRILWPEFEVFWFNSVLNRSSEWGTYPFHWYLTSALPRALLGAYPLSLLGVLLDRRMLFYIIPVYSFVLLYSKLPHKELRFIIAAVPIFNLSAAVAASRIYNNRKKRLWNLLYFIMVGSIVVSLGCTVITFLASYENYPSGYALKYLHTSRQPKENIKDQWIHIDSFSAMSGISRFCEDDSPWRYSKEEGIPLGDLQFRNFTYLISEHTAVDGFKCLFYVKGFSRVRLQIALPPIIMVTEPKVFVHGNLKKLDQIDESWPGCL